MPSIQRAVAWAIETANDDTHGYDQENRNGPDYDCSSFVATALHNGGFNVSTESWTGNLYSQLIACGFRSVPISAPRDIGHIFLNEAHHVIMCINPTQIVQASINEHGGTTGGQTGDQTGREIYITDYYNYSSGWDYHLVPPNSSYIVDAQWHAKETGSYSPDSQEALDNVTLMSSILVEQGWSLEAIAAMLGSGAGESGLNPWRWESDIVPTVSQAYGWTPSELQSHGYGMWQFTPFKVYVDNAQSYPGYAPNFFDRAGYPTDGEAQTRFMSDHVPQDWSHGLYNYYKDDFDAIGVNIDEFYWMTYDEFKAGTGYTIAQLTGAYTLCYLRPADWAAAGSYNYRATQAQYWYEILQTIPIGPTKKKSFNIMFYLKPKWKRGF